MSTAVGAGVACNSGHESSGRGIPINQQQQQRKTLLSSSVPGSLDSYQVETETIDSGLGADSSFFLTSPCSMKSPMPVTYKPSDRKPLFALLDLHHYLAFVF